MNISEVELYYLSPNKYGGWVTFTYHLVEALHAVGIKAKVKKVHNDGEACYRDFGYGIKYQNVSHGQAIASTKPKIVVAAAKKFRAVTQDLLEEGACLILHDPTELKNIDGMEPDRTVVIRQAGLRYVPQATFIRHPYKSTVTDSLPLLERPQLAVSTSRIDFDKHTEILLDANRLLEPDKKIKIYGFENRIFTRFQIVEKYPEWEQSKSHYPREKTAATDILKNAVLAVDMSEIKGDGGGTQYTFLEAWDAGAIPVIYNKWFPEWWDPAINPDDLQPEYNCLTVANAIELADVVKTFNDPKEKSYLLDMQRLARVQLVENHTPEVIGLQYKKFLEARF